MTDFQGSILSIVTTLLERSDKGDLTVALDTAIHGDGLGLDSLETAELSAMLEDEFGTDPFGAGLMPETVGEIVDFYTEGEASVPA
ncbi:acyl carrier protein [Nocardioides humilatus]|uniref:Acyl carrier protein n=1 Tax=Nocardioides humilatus TaxID=2607660 RepID=A0A5B1LNW5_9ACTN|nr:phosphopantetheine-binding protein [Nocardioides humilatus]KAA1421470.1 acyl carrier protein [Nocardioides humilatus]